MAGRGTFHVIDGARPSVPSFDLGFLGSTVPIPELPAGARGLIRQNDTNGGIFIRFSHPNAAGLSTRFFPFPSNGKYMFSVHAQRVDCSLVSAGSTASSDRPGDPRPKIITWANFFSVLTVNLPTHT